MKTKSWIASVLLALAVLIAVVRWPRDIASITPPPMENKSARRTTATVAPQARTTDSAVAPRASAFAQLDGTERIRLMDDLQRQTTPGLFSAWQEAQADPVKRDAIGALLAGKLRREPANADQHAELAAFLHDAGQRESECAALLRVLGHAKTKERCNSCSRLLARPRLLYFATSPSTNSRQPGSFGGMARII